MTLAKVAGRLSLRLANAERVPVTPRAAGSGLSCGAVPFHGGIVLSVERMNRILEIDRENMVIVVQPGVITNDVNDAVNQDGLFYAGYPMSVELCFIGGNVAENAGGGRAIKYGVTGRYVLGMEVVLPTGEILEVGPDGVRSREPEDGTLHATNHLASCRSVPGLSPMSLSILTTEAIGHGKVSGGLRTIST